MIDPVIELSLRVGLALLFAAAAWHKVSDHVRFDAALRAYQLLPSWMLRPAAWLLPTLEAATAMALLRPSMRLHAAWAAASLLLTYTGAIAVNLLRGRHDIDCGCFRGSSGAPLSTWLLGRNLSLLAATWVLTLPVRPRTLLWVDAVTVSTTLLTLSLLWMAGQRLARTGPALRRLGGAP